MGVRLVKHFGYGNKWGDILSVHIIRIVDDAHELSLRSLVLCMHLSKRRWGRRRRRTSCWIGSLYLAAFCSQRPQNPASIVLKSAGYAVAARVPNIKQMWPDPGQLTLKYFRFALPFTIWINFSQDNCHYKILTKNSLLFGEVRIKNSQFVTPSQPAYQLIHYWISTQTHFPSSSLT